MFDIIAALTIINLFITICLMSSINHPFWEVSMRRIRYQVACSLDGYIADSSGRTGWIIEEPEIDFEELYNQFDTLLMGRLTYEDILKQGSGFWGKQVVVFSRILRQEDHPEVTIVSDQIDQKITELRTQPGKDIWLFGGGELFRTLLDFGCVDTVEPAIMPVLLGGGRPFLPTPAASKRLRLMNSRTFPSGIVWLEYTVLNE
jgi:dihydrofolate reductase